MKHISLILLFATMITAAYGQQATFTLQTNTNELSFSKQGEEDKIYLTTDFQYNTTVGDPELPVKTIEIIIPANQTISGIQIVEKGEQVLPGEYNIPPVQEPQIMGQQEVVTTTPKSSTYTINSFYPANIIEYIGEGLIAGTKIATLYYYPVQYNPVTKKIKIINQVTFLIQYASTGEPQQTTKPKLSKQSYQVMVDYIQSRVLNPEALSSNLQFIEDTPSRMRTAPSLPDKEDTKIDYVIITVDSLVSGFQQLADWKTRKGTFSKVVTTDWIYENFDGRDEADQIRNFIKHAKQNWGSIWFLMGGEPSIVPVRYVWISHFNNYQMIGSYPQGLLIPTDMYYAGLDGNWNKDGDSTYGEGNWNRQENGDMIMGYTSSDIDEADLYPDVFVGRIPVRNNAELNNYLAKYFKYIRGQNVNPLWTLLFSMNSTGLKCKEMDSVAKPFPNHINIEKMYECVEGNTTHCGTKQSVLDALNRNTKTNSPHIICGFGHGGDRNFTACTDNIIIDEIEGLQNANTSGQIFFNNQCHTMAWDKDCIGAKYLTIQNGGIAYIGNTREGWSGDPAEYNKKFIRNIYNGMELGNALYNGKGHGARHDTYARWSFFTLNLSGDPEMAVWTNTIQQITNSLSVNSMNCEQKTINVSVQNLSSGEKARICLYKENEIFEVQDVAGNGTYAFSVHPLTPGSIHVTITAANRIPVEKQITVNPNQNPHIYLYDVSINDRTGVGSAIGNGNGLIDAGETIEVYLEFKNNGREGISGFNTNLTCESEYINITTTSHYHEWLDPEEVSRTPLKYIFTVSENAPQITQDDLNRIIFDVNISHGYGNVQNKFSIDVISPEIEQGDKTITGGTGITNPNQLVQFNIQLINTGDVEVKGLTAFLTYTGTGQLSSCSTTPRLYPDLGVGARAFSNGWYEIRTSNSYDPSQPLEFNLRVMNEYGKEWNFPFDLNENIQVKNINFTPDYKGVKLFWDNQETARAYNVYRCSTDASGNMTGSFVRLNDFPLEKTYYNDSGLEISKKYYYKVSVISKTGKECSLSEPFLAWTQAKTKYIYPLTLDFDGIVWGVNVADLNATGYASIIQSAKSKHIAAIDYMGYNLFSNGFNNITGEIWGNLTAGELVNNGKYGIVGGTYSANSSGNSIFCYAASDANGDGYADLLWKKNTNYNCYRGVVLSNIDNSSDDSKEVIPYYTQNRIEIYNGTTGELKKSFASGTGDNYGGIGVADLNGDGNKEIIRPSDTGIYIWKHDGTPFISNKQPICTLNDSYEFKGSPVICDIDNDGQKEILAMAIWGNYVHAPTKLVAYKTNGTPVANFNNFSFKNEVKWVTPDFSVGDLDRDGVLEIVIAQRDTVYILDNHGTIKAKHHLPALAATGAPILADVDGISDIEIIVSSAANNKIFAIKMDGTPIHGFPIMLNDMMKGSPCVADIDRDGKNELIAGVNDMIYVWETNGYPALIEWGHERHNQYNTGEYAPACVPQTLRNGGSWTSTRTICGDLVVLAGTLKISNEATLIMGTDAKITVKNGARLELDKGFIYQGNIKLESGSTLTIKNSGRIILRKKGDLYIEKGAILDFNYGDVIIP